MTANGNGKPLCGDQIVLKLSVVMAAQLCKCTK